MWINRSEWDALKAKVKCLEDRVATIPSVQMGVGAKVYKHNGFFEYMDYKHHITLEQAIRMLAQECGLEFDMKDATPAIPLLHKTKQPHK